METVREKLTRLLDHLAGNQVGRQGTKADESHRAALDYENIDRLPIVFSYPFPEATPFRLLPNDAIYKEPAAMLHNELASAWGTSIALGDSIGDDLPPTIRPNWGTVLVASVLGGYAEQEGENTPWIRRNDAAPVTLEAIAEADPEIASSGWIPRVLETYEAYDELLSPYPELKKGLRLTLPDLQGPLDTVEQLTGADLFVDLIERPALAERAFRRAAEIQIACARLFEPFVRDGGGEVGGSGSGGSGGGSGGSGSGGYAHQHGFLIKGRILIRCDSAVMISPEMYRELVAPADESVLSALGGGGIHSCGRIGHAVPDMLKLDSIRCFDFGQSFMNDVDFLYTLARKRRIPFLRVQPSRGELQDATIMDRFPTGVSLLYDATSIEDAKVLFGKYSESAALRAVRGRKDGR